MPDRDVNTIRDLIYYQYAKIIAKSAFAAPDGVQEVYDSITPLLPSAAAATAQARPTLETWTGMR
jgi:hypothetical protein